MTFYNLLLANELRGLVNLPIVEPGISGVLRKPLRGRSYVTERMHAGKPVSMALHGLSNLSHSYSIWLDRMGWGI